MTSYIDVKKIPLISVITVCLNEPNLERTCESIVNQTFQDFEWIVIDGGSNAETLAIFEKYKSRMSYFVSEADGGIYYGMNKGVRQARGEWVNFMNAGDYFAQTDVMAEIVNYIDVKFSSVDIIYGNYVVGKDSKFNVIESPDVINKKCLFYTMPHHEASFIKKQLFDLYGYYDTKYSLMADWDFCLTLVTKHQRKFCKIEIPILVYSQEGRSSTNRTQIFKELSKIRALYFSQEEIMNLKKEQAQQIRYLLQNNS